ncbi:hypothetical protein FACS189499_06240 [Clostridia bacterium]|nr:hypothetical protein FACS189499_06240 [Clostridia bacterium]
MNTNRNLEGVSAELSDILYYASLAPNSHNAQMWKVKISPQISQISVYLDTERTLEKVDSTNREAYISIGAYVENLLAAFEAYGYETKLKIPDDSGENLTVLTYKKVSDSEIKSEINSKIIGNILLRHTDKSEFLSKSIDKNDIDFLLKNNSNLYYFGSESDSFEYIKTATIEANKIQAENQEKRDELADWFRFSNGETIAKKDGLPAEQLGFSGLKKVIYYLITSRQTAKGDTFAEQGVETAENQVENSAGFFVLTGNDTKKELIETGMALQSFWLNATELGISVQPISQILEEIPYKNDIKKELNIDTQIQMILRVGYVRNYGENAQIRRDLNEYIAIE